MSPLKCCFYDKKSSTQLEKGVSYAHSCHSLLLLQCSIAMYSQNSNTVGWLWPGQRRCALIWSFPPKITTPETSCFSENHQGGKEVQCHWWLNQNIFSRLCQYQILPVKTVWVTFNKIKELLKVFSSSFRLYSPFYFLCTNNGINRACFLLWLVLYGTPTPFSFHGWAPKGNMDPGVYSELGQCKGYCTKVWGREASRKWE